MAEAPKRDRAEQKRQEPEQAREQRREASERGAGRAEGWEDIDRREEEGWTQPESSAQKGALPDEG